MMINGQHSNKFGWQRSIVTLTVLTALSVINLSSYPIIIKLFSWVATGFILAGLFSLAHACAHGILFKAKSLNRWTGRLAAMLLLSNYEVYRCFHLQHHRKTSVAGDSEPGSTIPSKLHYLFYCLNWDYTFAFLRLSFAALFNRFPFFIISQKDQKNCKDNALWLLAFLIILGISTILWPLTLILFYWIPFQIAVILNFFLVLGEHYGCEESSDVFNNTRSYKSPGFLFDYFHYLANYHAEHHLYPSVPPNQIHKIHLKLGPKLKYGNQSYFCFHREVFSSLPMFPKALKKGTVDKVRKVYERPDSFFFNLEKRDMR